MRTTRDFDFDHNHIKCYRLRGAETETRHDNVEVLRLGRIEYRSTTDDEWAPPDTPLSLRAQEWLRDEARLVALAELKSDRLDALERSKHQPYCTRRAKVSSRDRCDCGHTEERSGRVA